MEWQPIETAPKDGTKLLVYGNWGYNNNLAVGYWDDHPKCNCWIAGGYMRKKFLPTHWMILPEYPN